MVGIDPDRQGVGADVGADVAADVGVHARTADADPQRLHDALRAVGARSAGQIGAENFPVALRVLPRWPRTQLAAVYRYARFVDDVGDEAPGDRGELLDRVEADVRALDGGTPTLPAVAGLRPVVRDCRIPLTPLLDLVRANRDDQVTTERGSFADLLAYCELSAAPIGRLVLYVAGAATPVNVLDSDQVCAALQVLEHCQDVREDARAGRVYLPQDDLRAARVPTAELTASTTSAALRGVVALQVDRAADLLQAGGPLVRRLHGWARVAVAGYVAGGLATVAALRRHDHDVLGVAVRPSRRRTATTALALALGRRR